MLYAVLVWTRFVVIPWTKCPKYLYGLQLPRGPGVWSDPAPPTSDWRELVEFMDLNLGIDFLQKNLVCFHSNCSANLT